MNDKESGEKAEKCKSINLKSGRYIRVSRDSKHLKKNANFSFSYNLKSTATIYNLSYEYMKEYLVETNAVMEIHGEFLKNRKFNSSISKKTTQESTQEITQEKILELMQLNPSITAKEISLKSGITFDGVSYHIKKLRDSGNIKKR